MAKLCVGIAKFKGYTEIEISEFNTAKTMVEWDDSSPIACHVCSNASCLGELANGVEPTCKYAKERFKDLK